MADDRPVEAGELYAVLIDLLRVIEWWSTYGYLTGVDIELPDSVPRRARELVQRYEKGRRA